MTSPEDTVLRNLRKLRAEFPEAGKAITREIAKSAEKQVQKETVRNTSSNVTVGKTPVITGDLVSTTRVIEDDDSIRIVVGGIPGKSGNVVDYAYYVEVGTRKFKGRRYLKGGVQRALVDVDSIAIKALNSWVKQNTNK